MYMLILEKFIIFTRDLKLFSFYLFFLCFLYICLQNYAYINLWDLINVLENEQVYEKQKDS